MPAKKIAMAIAYDFDGTLSPGNMQNYNFVPSLNLSPGAFWKEVKTHAKKHDMDEILAYMDLMLSKANHLEVSIHKKAFQDYGKGVQFFPGVTTWFNRINAFAKTQDVHLEHFVISSGLREMIAGTEIAKHFKCIFASGFRYDQHGVAKWPALAINYTTKTQYLFRINKGIHNAFDNSRINDYVPEADRPVPFRNMIYIGDGETDIPPMKMIRYQGGHAVAVFPSKTKGARDKAAKLLKEQRAQFAFRADYTEGSSLSSGIQEIIKSVAAANRLSKMKVLA